MALQLLFCGTLCAQAGTLELATDLFSAGDWHLCQRECRRVLISNPASIDAQVFAAICDLRLERKIETSIETLASAADNENTSMTMRTLASYECGRALWKRGEIETAHDRLAFTYCNTTEKQLFLRAGCSLFMLMHKNEKLKERVPSLTLQITSSRALYNWKLQQECSIEKSNKKALSKPGEWIVGIYRKQIGPAIGMRCSCVPSCSEYFLRACKKHGLLGFPIQADRFFREPSIVQKQKNPVAVGNQIRYADPLKNHDFWLNKD